MHAKYGWYRYDTRLALPVYVRLSIDDFISMMPDEMVKSELGNVVYISHTYKVHGFLVIILGQNIYKRNV